MKETRAYAEKCQLPPTYRGKLVIFTTFYKHQAYAGYVHSLALTAMVLGKLGIEWDYWPYSGDFHVERAVNRALTNFLASDATDFVCIDSDEAWNVEGLFRLITRPVEIIGGAYKKTNDWEQYTCKFKVDDNGVPMGEIMDGEPVLEVDRLPAGFLRVTKPVLQKFIEAYPDRWYWDYDKDGTRHKVYQFLTTVLRDHEFFSQDFNFSEDLKAIGVKLWLEPNITIGHFGLTEYIGNVDQHLRGLHAQQQAEKAKQGNLATAMANIEAFAKAQKAA